jgi:uncharacterized membrane protein
LRSSGVSDGFHPGDIASTQEIKHRHTPRRMKFHTSTSGADPRMTRAALIAVIFILVALFLCLAMWLATLGPFTGGRMVIPGILFGPGA